MLYQNEGIYRYKGGVNWRAVVALVIVIPINLPGLINAIDKTVDTGNHKFFCTSFCLTPTFYPSIEDLFRRCTEIKANNTDKASWLTSFFICAAVYLALSKISPPTSTFVDRTVESLDDELHSGDQHDIQDGHELAAWEKKKSTSNDSASDDKVAPYNGGAPGL